MLVPAFSCLLMSSINRRFHVAGLHKAVRSITRACITCQRITVRPQPQMLGQLPMEPVTPDSVFRRRLRWASLCEVRIYP